MTKAANEQRRTLWIELRPEQYDAQRRKVEEIVAQDTRTTALYVSDCEGHVILLTHTTCDPALFRGSGATVEIIAPEHVRDAERGIQMRSLQAQIAELSGRNGDGDHYLSVRNALAAYAYEAHFPEPPKQFENVQALTAYVEGLTLAVLEGKERVETEKKRDNLDARVVALEKQGEEARAAHESEKADYEGQVAEQRKEREALEDALESALNDKRFAEETLYKLRQASIELDGKKRALEAQVENFKKGITDANVERLRVDVRALAQKVGDYKRENEQLKAQIVAYERKQGDLEAENFGLKKRYEEAAKHPQELEAEAKERREVYERVENDGLAGKVGEYDMLTPKALPNAQKSRVTEAEDLIPDPEAETTAELFVYLFGRRENLFVENVFREHKIEIHRRTGRGGATAIYRFGAIDGQDRLTQIVTAVHERFHIADRTVEESVAFVRNYFTAGDQNGYNPEQWEDSKIVTRREAALGARKAEHTLTSIFHKNNVVPEDGDGEKKYRVGNIRPILMNSSLHRPEQTERH